jgi:hypothetical protein
MAQAPLPPAPNKYLEGKRCSGECFFAGGDRLHLDVTGLWCVVSVFLLAVTGYI